MSTDTENATDSRRTGARSAMSPTTPPRRSPGSAEPGAPGGGRTVPRARGTLTLSEQVIEKIASQSASEVAAAGGESGGFLGIGQHSDLGARPKVDVELRETSADLFVSVAMPYGVSIRQTTQRVRDRVSQEVERLTGVAVHRVDVDVAVLVLPDPDHSEGRLR